MLKIAMFRNPPFTSDETGYGLQKQWWIPEGRTFLLRGGTVSRKLI